MTDEEFRTKLTPEQYHVLREGGTEAPFSGEYVSLSAAGDYACAACGNILFKSDTKFDSGCGWPTFYDVADRGAVTLHEDRSAGMQRIMIRCAKCGSHLGHVFNDAPDQPTGLRFCVNSAGLKFKDTK